MITPQEVVVCGVDRTKDLIDFSNAIGLEQATSGRHSLLFLIELFFRTTALEDINPFMVIAEIKYLEGIGKPTGTKEASMFHGPILSGLWHKHHLETGLASMATNLQLALKNYGLPVMEAMVKETEEKNEERYLEKSDIAKIVDDIVHGNYERRANDNRLTGEWIIYAKHAGQNYYLCTGKHGSDERIRQKIEAICLSEFPFIGETLKPL